jgi:hypothetical protein
LPRLFEISDWTNPILIGVGDVLLVRAAGARITSGQASLELLGTFVSGAFSREGEAVWPEGLPNIVLYRSRQVGTAISEVVIGGALGSPVRKTLEVQVQ